MNRRDLLASLGGLGAASVAGCVANGSADPPDGTTKTTRTDGTNRSDETTSSTGETTTTDDGAGWGPDAETPFESVTVGDRDGVAFPDDNRAHGMRVWNDADDERSISLVLTREGDAVFDRTLQFPADGWVKLTLNEPGNYELALGVDGQERGTVAVDRTRFDCNSSVTNVTVNAEGAVDAATMTTLVACAGPKVADTSFERGDGRCGSGDEASVAFEDEVVRVDGSIETPTPCHDLSLASATLEGSESHVDGDDVLVVTVTTDGRRGGGCTDCVGNVDYEATIGFDHAYPSNVRVVHDSMGGERTVLEVPR